MGYYDLSVATYLRDISEELHKSNIINQKLLDLQLNRTSSETEKDLAKLENVCMIAGLNAIYDLASKRKTKEIIKIIDELRNVYEFPDPS